jgi:F-type H+-transporting ATPase subunit delta
VSFAGIAQRYAQAIFELGVETSNLASIVEDIRNATRAYACSAELGAMMESPLVPEAARLSAMEEIATQLGLCPLAKNATLLLARRKRMSLLPEITRQLDRMKDEREGVVRVTVVSALPLGDAYAQRLEKELEAVTGKKVVMERKQNQELLAGVVVQIGDRVIDGSARATLQKLRSELLAL